MDDILHVFVLSTLGSLRLLCAIVVLNKLILLVIILKYAVRKLRILQLYTMKFMDGFAK